MLIALAFGCNLKYRIQPTMSDGFLANVFSMIESEKKSLGIRNYSVGQTALEQIFLQFARQGDDLSNRIEEEQKSAQSA